MARGEYQLIDNPYVGARPNGAISTGGEPFASSEGAGEKWWVANN